MGTSGWPGSLRALGRDLGQGLLHLLYPGACVACGEPFGPGRTGFCDSCRVAVTTDPFPTCPRCAATVGPYVNLADGCTACRGMSLRFERAIRLGPYDGPLRDLVLRMKHAAGELLAEELGALWAHYAGQRLRDLGADVVVPVPLHWWRRWVRGYNQSEALAHALATALRLPCRPGCLRRVRNTPLQTRQTPASRRTNVRGAFRARAGPALRGKTVLLVDDVMTTGSTCGEAARALCDAGAARVVVAALAHG